MSTSNQQTELRIHWRRGWLTSLYEFANVEFQRKLWIEGSCEGLCGSFVECMCGYFDDLALDDGYESVIEKGLISKEEAEAVHRFHVLASQYEPCSEDQKEIVSDSNWLLVVNEAISAWHNLKRIVDAPQDIETMRGLEWQYGAIEELK